MFTDRHQFNRVGETVQLECKYDESVHQSPSITWYKISDDGKQKLYMWDGATQTGSEVPTNTKARKNNIFESARRLKRLAD